MSCPPARGTPAKQAPSQVQYEGWKSVLCPSIIDMTKSTVPIVCQHGVKLYKCNLFTLALALWVKL